MIKIKKTLLLIWAIGMIIVPFNTSAESKINIYFFKQSGCPHCAEAENFFESIEKEYGELYKLIEYNIYGNEGNYNLLRKIKKAMKETENGVPYIVIGKEDFLGFSDGNSKQILEAIQKEYESKNRYDIMDHLNAKKSIMEDIIVVMSILLGIITIGYIRYKNKI